MSKCFIFVSAISSSMFGGSDWTLAESTLSVFACQCGGGGGDGGDGSGDGGTCGRGDGGGCGGDGCGWVDGGSGGGDAGHNGGGDFSGEECFYGLYMGLLLEMGCLPHFPTRWVGTFWSRNAPVLLN